MKIKVIISLLLIICAGSMLAQEENEYLKLKNEGNEALRSKDYKKALDFYESALTLWPAEEKLDAAMIYNTAECARRIKDNEKALLYFKQSQSLNYRPDRCAYYMAVALKALEREEEMEELLVQSIAIYNMKEITDMLVNYYVNQGKEAYNRASKILGTVKNANPSQYAEIEQRANEAFAEAQPWFEKALEIDPSNADAASLLETINSRLAEKK